MKRNRALCMRRCVRSIVSTTRFLRTHSISRGILPMRVLFTAFAFCLALMPAAMLPAGAQTTEGIIYGPHGVPQYNSWQSAWDRYEFDRHHVILGRVAAFAPYRLQVARRDGVVQM